MIWIETLRFCIFLFQGDPDLLRRVIDNFIYDAYVACDVDDRIFVLQDLLPILENASTESFGEGVHRKSENLFTSNRKCF